MSSEITETMLKFNDEKEKELNKEEEKTKQNIKKLDKEYKQKLKDLIDSGGFSMEGITEIRMIIYLIQNCPDEMKPAQENMGKCLEILVNMSNQYLQIYKNENQELWNDENEIENEIE